MKLRIFVAAALLALHGCAAGPGARSDLEPVEVAGDYRHEPSGFVFPAQIEDFRRISIFRRGTDAQRVIVGYAGGPPACLAAVTLFVSPALPTIDESYARAAAEVREAYPNATLQREERHPKLQSRFADYVIDDRRLQLVVEEQKPGWLFSYRVMFPKSCVETPIFLGGFFTQLEMRQR
jgi:hypothetical protein